MQVGGVTEMHPWCQTSKSTPSLIILILSKNHPGLSEDAFGSVHICILNCILSAPPTPSREESEKLLVTQPLCNSDAKTGTGDDAPLGIGASVDMVLG